MLRRFISWPSLGAALLLMTAFSPCVRAQANKGDAIASLRATGQVFVNGSPVKGEVTLFAGDAIRTGDTGAAGVTISGRGTITIAAKTQASIGGGPYFVKLDSGEVDVRTFAGAKTIDVQFGEFVVTEETEVEAAADVRVTEDGAALVRCTEGSVGVINLKGPQSPFIQPGQSVSVDATGAMQVSQAGMAVPSGTPIPSPGGEVANVKTGSKTPWIVLGVAGAGGGVAAALLLSKGSSKPAVSPSSP